MLLLKGTPAGFNYTYGPALIYYGPKSIATIYSLGEPVILIADNIPMDELRKIEMTRVRGFVFSEGSASVDEDLFNFLQMEKRAAVLSCEGCMDYICDADMVIVDGVDGYVCLEPNEETLAAFQAQRKLGAPKDRNLQIQKIAASMLEGLIQERAEAEAKGEKIRSGPIPKEEALALAKNQPGLVYQLLAGLPLPGSPTAGDGHEHDHLLLEHGAPPGTGGEDHDHAPGDPDHDHGHDHGDGTEGMSHADAVRAKRAAKQAERKAREEG